MPNKITVDWDSKGMEWDDLTASLSALREYENTPDSANQSSGQG